MCLTTAVAGQFLWSTNLTYKASCFIGENALLGVKSVMQFFAPDVEEAILEERAFIVCTILTGLTALRILSTLSPPVIGAILVIASIVCIYRGEELFEIVKKSLGFLEKVAKVVDLSYQKIIENFPLVLEALSVIKEQNQELQRQLEDQTRRLTLLQTSVEKQTAVSQDLFALNRDMDRKLDALTPQKGDQERLIHMLSQRECPECKHKLYA